jgi:hypothetical protein
MKHLVDYIESGRPIIGIRTATHAFNTKSEKYGKYTWTNKDPAYEQGFGRQVLGETWISHHGKHGSQSTRGMIAEGRQDHPILRGIKDGDIWGPTDVYGVRQPLPGDSLPLVLGQVVDGMKPDDPPAAGKANDPMMPIAWTKTYKKARVFTSTIGAANDLTAEGTRRLLVNACYWAVGLEGQIPEKSNVALVGDFQPSNFKFNGAKSGARPEDHELKQR